LQYHRPSLRISFAEGVRLLREAGYDASEEEDLDTEKARSKTHTHTNIYIYTDRRGAGRLIGVCGWAVGRPLQAQPTRKEAVC
jgi:hypothetical protein